MDILWLASNGALWVIVIIEAVLLLALARQIGLLHERLGAGGARIMNAGPGIGQTAPELDATDVNGQLVTLGVGRNKRTLLLFISTGCSTCTALMPRLRKLAHDERDNLEIKLIAFGTSLEAAQKYITEHRLDGLIPFVTSDDIAFQYQVTIAPYGVIVDRTGLVRSKGLVNNFAHIESLLNAKELGVRSIEEYLQREQALQVG